MEENNRFTELTPIKQITDLNVVQANELIRSRQDELTLLEAKLIRLAIAQVLVDDKDLKTYTVEVIQLADLLGISRNYIYAELDKLTTDLLRKVIYIYDKSSKGKKNYIKFHWCDTAKYQDGIITIKLSEELKPYLIGLNELFTRYSYEEIIGLPTTNAIRLYELLASYENLRFTKHSNVNYSNIEIEQNEVVFTIEYLKDYFNCIDSYKNNSDFIKYVIDSSVKFIEDKTVLGVSYRTVKEKNKIKYIVFKLGEWTQGREKNIYNYLKQLEDKDKRK